MSKRKIIVYTDGIFDLFHFGHANLFRKIKHETFSDYSDEEIYLIVGVASDIDTHSKKGITVMNEKDRYNMVSQCKYVDMVIESCPWIINLEFIEKYKIDYVAREDSPYIMGSEDGEDIYQLVKSLNKFKHVSRTDNISSTDIITKIIKNYNHYLVRNLKRGIDRNDLNLSTWKAFQVMFSYKLKSGELINDIEKKVDKVSYSIHDSLLKKNQEISNSLEESVKFFNKQINSFSSKTFVAGGLFGAFGFYFINNLNMFKNINLRI